MNVIIDIPKIETFGEDAPPINLEVSLKNRVISVFDGLGGAGSSQYEENGEKKTGAYISSRVVGKVVLDYFDSLKNQNITYEVNNEFIDNLKSQIITALKDKLKLQKYEVSKLKSSLIRTFPTTIALINCDFEDNKIKLDVIWAGDSRAYVLTPQKGLIQLSKDDLKSDNDPFENLKNDSPLSNMICLENDFNLNLKSYSFDSPLLAIVATDGCFGYYSTPMHFEYYLLKSLMDSNNEEDYKSKLEQEFSKVTGDDFSLSLTCIIKTNFSEIKENFKNRYQEIYLNYMKDILDLEKSIEVIDSEIKERENKITTLNQKKNEMNLELWNNYKSINYNL
jgi:serine/threonine protein phosphatase PrpC